MCTHTAMLFHDGVVVVGGWFAGVGRLLLWMLVDNCTQMAGTQRVGIGEGCGCAHGGSLHGPCVKVSCIRIRCVVPVQFEVIMWFTLHDFGFA